MTTILCDVEVEAKCRPYCNLITLLHKEYQFPNERFFAGSNSNTQSLPLPIGCSSIKLESIHFTSLHFTSLQFNSGSCPFLLCLTSSLLWVLSFNSDIFFAGWNEEEGGEDIVSTCLFAVPLSTFTFRKNTSGGHKMVSSAYLAFTILVSVAAGLALAAELYSTGFGFKAAEQGSTPQTTEEGSIPQAPGSVYIVHLEKKDDANASEKSHLETLSSVFDGSHEKAKEAILYSYTNSMNGFSAKLTPEQVSELSKKPGVLAVNPQGVSHLHGKPNTHVGAAKAGLSRKGV